MDELKEVTILYKELNSKSDSVNNRVMSVFEKYYIVTLYSIWESATIDAMKRIFSNYAKLFNKKDFVFKYLEQVFSTPYIKKKFKESIKDDIFYDFNKVTEDFLINNDNMWYKSLIEFFKIYDFDTDMFEKYLLSDKKLQEMVRQLGTTQSIDLKISAEYLEKFNKGTQENTEYFRYKITGYIDYLVDKRNSYSHSYKRPYSVFSYEDFDKLHHFFERIIYILNRYVDEQLNLKIIDGYKNNQIDCKDEHYLIRKLEVSDLGFLEKKPDDINFSIEVKFKEKQTLEKNSKIIIYNCKKDSKIDMICQFSLKSKKYGEKFNIENSDDIMNFNEYESYRLILEDDHQNRVIRKNEMEDLELFVQTKSN